MGKLDNATEALLLQAVADATANMRPQPRINDSLTFAPCGSAPQSCAAADDGVHAIAIDAKNILSTRLASR